MSKIGKINISIPEKVKVALAGNMINIEGPLGKKSINIAKEAIYQIDSIKLGTENYRKSGGRYSFTDYYRSRYGKAILDTSLKKRIVFDTHNVEIVFIRAAKTIVGYITPDLTADDPRLLEDLAKRGKRSHQAKEKLISGEFPIRLLEPKKDPTRILNLKILLIKLTFQMDFSFPLRDLSLKFMEGTWKKQLTDIIK